jgi:signal transduction histidine kinase
MGVGLFITQAIVEAHHGTIEAVSNPLGARFVIHLPLTSEMNSLDSVIPVSDTK